MYFVGLDLAWGEKNNKQSGVAVLTGDGRLVHVATAVDDASIIAELEPYVAGDCLVAIDAPLIVRNPDGRRRAEAELSKHFHPFDAGAYPANTNNPHFMNPRGAVLASALGLDMDPRSVASRRAIEVFPHPATVVLFDLPRIYKYKKGDVEERRSELLELMTKIASLEQATPRMRVNHNVAWVELQNRVAAATRPVQLDKCEDVVDAAVCAYVGLYWHRRPEDVTIYGDYETGYIVTPTLPAGRAAVPKKRQKQTESAELMLRSDTSPPYSRKLSSN